MRLKFTIALLLISGTASASKSLDMVLNLAKEKAYRSSHVDWPATEQTARSIEVSQGEDAAIRFVLKALADKHTFYFPKTSSNTTLFHGLPNKSASEIAAVTPNVDSVPTLQINSWSGSDLPAATAKVRAALADAMHGNPCGLILDFSHNSGGNMWPMLVGLSPLLEDGKLGAFKRADGTTEQINRRDGLIYHGERPDFLNYPAIEVLYKAPKFVAVVIGPRSSSSGEITPLMFHGKGNVRFFGKQTSGYTSSNQTFQLPNGGTLLLTTAMTEDRDGHAYPDGIVPDVQTDNPLEEAATWLHQKCR